MFKNQKNYLIKSVCAAIFKLNENFNSYDLFSIYKICIKYNRVNVYTTFTRSSMTDIYLVELIRITNQMLLQKQNLIQK